MSESEFVEVKLQMPKTVYEFIKEYVNFFSGAWTVEQFCRFAIYDAVETIYKELKAIAEGEVTIPTHIPKDKWLLKWQLLLPGWAEDEGC